MRQRAIDDSGLNSETGNASRVVIHHHKYSIRS